jgi:hypothetical protein
MIEQFNLFVESSHIALDIISNCLVLIYGFGIACKLAGFLFGSI